MHSTVSLVCFSSQFPITPSPLVLPYPVALRRGRSLLPHQLAFSLFPHSSLHHFPFCFLPSLCSLTTFSSVFFNGLPFIYTLRGFFSFIIPPFTSHLLKETCISPSFVLPCLLSPFFPLCLSHHRLFCPQIRRLFFFFLPPNHYSGRAFTSFPCTFFSLSVC